MSIEFQKTAQNEHRMIENSTELAQNFIKQHRISTEFYIEQHRMRIELQKTAQN